MVGGAGTGTGTGTDTRVSGVEMDIARVTVAGGNGTCCAGGNSMVGRKLVGMAWIGLACIFESDDALSWVDNGYMLHIYIGKS